MAFHRTSYHFGLLAAAFSVLLACGGSSAPKAASNEPPAAPGNPSSPPASDPFDIPQFSHAAIVLEENTAYGDVIGTSAMPYLNSLAAQYTLAANYYANTHPSIGNYFMLTTGQTITNNDGFAGTVSADNIVRRLLSAGMTWKAYAESLPYAGYIGGDRYPYIKHHNPFAYISDVRNSTVQKINMVPFSQFAGDLANNHRPSFSFIIPNNRHNAHDCPAASNCTTAQKLRAADDWLKANISPLVSNAGFQQDGLLVIVFDESRQSDSANGGGKVAMVLISSHVNAGYQSATFLQHQSVLKLVETSLGLSPLLGAAQSAPDMADFFQ